MKPRILFINSVCGFGSTGRIVADLSRMKDHDSLVCYGRKTDLENVNSYKFAGFFDSAFGAIQTILFDNNLNICKNATKRLIRRIKEFNPDIIHLHNIHGYYVNVEMLFDFLKEYNKPVVWTLHDSWAFTGYCPDVGRTNCYKYCEKCFKCPHDFSYPFSVFKQRVEKEFYLKERLFRELESLTLVCPSNWLMGMVKKSFLKNKNVRVINNGINIDRFRISKNKNKKFTVLAVSSIWSIDKGPEELNKIIPLLDKDIDVVVVGSKSNIIKNAVTIDRTDSIDELRDFYSSSHLLINPTLDDNFPSVNIEALACGTPVVTYNTGGSPESIDSKTGRVVDKADYKAMAKIINELKDNYIFKSDDCVDRSKMFSVDAMVSNYRSLYESLLTK